MYYSSGNYEAFATPKKPEGVDHKSAYIIGSGLAALTIDHFNMWKNYGSGKKLKNYTFGITWTITPQQVEDRKDW